MIRFANALGAVCLNQTARHESFPHVSAEHGIVDQAEFRNGRVTISLFRHGAESERTAARGAEMAGGRAVEPDRMRPVDRPFAAQRQKQLVLPVARHTRDAQDLAAANREGDVLEGCAVRAVGRYIEPLHDEAGGARCGAGPTRHRLDLCAEHQRRHAGGGFGLGVAGADNPAAAQDGGPITQGFDLGELVADVEDRAAFGGELAQGLEEPADLLRGEHRGRLVHDQQLRVEQQAAYDLDALALTDRQRMHRAIGIERQAIGGADAADAFGETRRTLRPVKAERYVLEHRHGLEQREMLEHHADAERPGLLRACHDHPRAIPGDRALVRLQDAKDGLDQGRLAGAVLAEKRVDLAGPDHEIDVGIGHDAGEALGQAAQFKPCAGRVLDGHPPCLPSRPRNAAPLCRPRSKTLRSVLPRSGPR